jgi:hypothetical protein
MMMGFASKVQAGWGGEGKPLEGAMQVKRIGKMSRARAWPGLNCC